MRSAEGNSEMHSLPEPTMLWSREIKENQNTDWESTKTSQATQSQRNSQPTEMRPFLLSMANENMTSLTQSKAFSQGKGLLEVVSSV